MPTYDPTEEFLGMYLEEGQTEFHAPDIDLEGRRLIKVFLNESASEEAILRERFAPIRFVG